VKKALENITNQAGFDHRVEIVISDNCSTDNTREVVMDFQRRFSNIVYHRNDQNLLDKNFIIALSHGRGEYLKMLNDTAVIKPGALEEILGIIQANIERRPVLFFANGTGKSYEEIKRIKGLNQFVKEASFYITWILTFGIWKDHFNEIENQYEGIELSLVQSVLLFKCVIKCQHANLYSKEYFQVPEVRNKGGYNLVNVFVGNYLGKILLPYYQHGEISGFTYRHEKLKLLRYFLLPWGIEILKSDSDYRFAVKGSMKTLLVYYWKYPIFYLLLIYLTYRVSRNWLSGHLQKKKSG
jgi:glycosyltransferase involved in cell wall biosynthesis